MNTIPSHHLPEIESKPCGECDGAGCESCHGTGIRDEEAAKQREIDRKNEYRNPGD